MPRICPRGPEYGVRGRRGDFEPLISEDLFYQVQAVLSGRIPKQGAAPANASRFSAPRLRPLRPRSNRQLVEGPQRLLRLLSPPPRLSFVNVSKAKLEGLFTHELALLHTTRGYMRLLKESVLQTWKARKTAHRDEIATVDRNW